MSIHDTARSFSLDNLLALEGQAIDFFSELNELEKSEFRSACGFLVSAILRVGIGKELGQSMSIQDWSLIHLFSDHDRWPLTVTLGSYVMKISKSIGQQPFVCFAACRALPA
ncbi:hypothetical protein [Roseobacter sp. N2S]|uniref:hypothetical protein n=1 Tax=Roseobacter sp. N2S TaxID=2663844 RepID=UPI002864CF52|nr:hypothetical protein [Roseobacter sp. N2S]MDR6265279.1 hypothetical protein [Roseobacter sp. N2S]